MLTHFNNMYIDWFDSIFYSIFGVPTMSQQGELICVTIMVICVGMVCFLNSIREHLEEEN